MRRDGEAKRNTLNTGREIKQETLRHRPNTQQRGRTSKEAKDETHGEEQGKKVSERESERETRREIQTWRQKNLTERKLQTGEQETQKHRNN